MVREEHKKIDEEKAKENVKKTPKKENKTTEYSGGEKETSTDKKPESSL